MLRKIRNSEFARNVLILFSGSLIAQIIPFLVLPFLQKYYFTPADFGLFALMISFCELFGNISCLKLEFAIVLQKKIKNAINLAFAALRVSWFVAFLGLFLVLFFKKEIASYLNEPLLENYLFLMPIYVVFFALNEIFSYWYNRKKNFVLISSSKVIQTSSAEFVKVTGGIIGFNYVSLVGGKIIGYIISVVYFAIRFFKEDKKVLRLINKNYSNQLIVENKKFILYSTPGVFISSIINFSYLFLFSHYFGNELVGMMGVSMTYIGAGLGVISVSFSQVFYSKIVEIEDKKQLLKVYTSFAKKLFLFILAPLIGIYLVPTSWVVYVLGEKWFSLIDIARVMIIWLCISFVSSSLSFIFIRLGRQKEMVLFDILHLVMILISFYLSYWILPTFNSTLWGFTIGQTLYYLLSIFAAIYFIKRYSPIK